MAQKNGIKIAAMAAFALYLGLMVFSQGQQLASRRLFWLDENYVLEHICKNSITQMIRNGAVGECSPAPLFDIALRAVYFKTIEEPMPIQFRLRWVPIFCGVISVLAIYFFTLPLGWLPASIVAIATSQQELFVDRFTESRPYILWLFWFTVLAGICAKIGSHSPRQTKWRELAVLTFAGLGLCSTVSPGIVQLGIGFLAILFFWLWRGESKEISKALAFKFIAAGAIASVPFFLYGIHTCTTQHADVVNSFFRGNTLEIFKSILFVLIPVSTVQSSSLTLIFFLGLVGPFVLFRTDVKNSRTWQSFSWVVLTQIGAGILLGGILAFRDYYFVPKLFSYFLTCRAFGIAVGLSILLRMASKAGDQVRLSGRVRTGLGVACVAGVLALAGLKHQRRFALILSQTDPLITSTEACPKLRGKVEFWTVPQADMGFANRGMFIAQMERELLRCGWTDSPGRTYVTATGILSDWKFSYSVQYGAPQPGASPIVYLGVPYWIRSPLGFLDLYRAK